jgi:NADPH:quinone reductase-like Zn-dependent oxidoreductase
VRACVLTASGGLQHLQVSDVPDAPAPGAGEVRVAVRAAALNHLDLFVVEGMPGIDLRFPHVVGADAAGVVESVGPGATGVRPGDRVLLNPGVSDGTCEFCRAGEDSLCVSYGILGEHRAGTIAELVTLPARNCAPLPTPDPALSWAEAAAFSLVTLTAWRMVVTRARLKAGETVLIWGIGGGVSLTALRIAKLLGATVFVTSSSDAKLEEARKLGADVTLNHRTQKIGQEVRARTQRRGVDLVIDNVGEATWDDSLRCLARGGRLVICGATSGPKVSLDLRRLFWHHWSILGSTMGSAAEYAEILRRLGQGELRPIVDRVYSLAQAKEAYERLARGEQLGKVVVEIPTP